MRTITCPRCGSSIAIYRAFRPTIKPFCARCGWNLQRAEVAVAGQNAATKFAPLAIGALAVIGAFALARTSSPVGVVVPLLVGGVMLIPAWSYFSTRNEIAAAKSTVNPSLATAQPYVDPSLQQLQALPRPRRVRFRIPNGLVVVLMIAGLIMAFGLYLAAGAARNGRAHVNGSGLLAIPIIFVFLLVVPYFRDKRNRPLLRDGELALGRVTYQQSVQAGKSSYSRIGYEFTTNSGQLIQDQAKDLTYSVYEDMTIPVFYDPTNPARNVTPCATYLQVSMNPF